MNRSNVRQNILQVGISAYHEHEAIFLKVQKPDNSMKTTDLFTIAIDLDIRMISQIADRTSADLDNLAMNKVVYTPAICNEILTCLNENLLDGWGKLSAYSSRNRSRYS